MTVAQVFYHYKQLGEALKHIPMTADISSVDIQMDGAAIRLRNSVKEAVPNASYEVSCLVDGTRIFHTEDKDGNIAPF